MALFSGSSPVKGMNESIPIVPYVPAPDRPAITTWSDFESTTKEEICEIIKNIRTKSGISNVNKTIMISSFSVFSTELTALINQSLREGFSLKCLRRADNKCMYTIRDSIEKHTQIQIFKEVFSELTPLIEKPLHRDLDIYALESPMEGFFDWLHQF